MGGWVVRDVRTLATTSFWWGTCRRTPPCPQARKVLTKVQTSSSSLGMLENCLGGWVGGWMGGVEEKEAVWMRYCMFMVCVCVGWKDGGLI